MELVGPALVRPGPAAQKNCAAALTTLRGKIVSGKKRPGVERTGKVVRRQGGSPHEKSNRLHSVAVRLVEPTAPRA
jgi:hypothetical protein